MNFGRVAKTFKLIKMMMLEKSSIDKTCKRALFFFDKTYSCCNYNHYFDELKSFATPPA